MPENPYLTGNYAPVDDELTTVDLNVTGSIPPELNGCLLRIGPNPINPDPDDYFWFLGNGMVHGLCLQEGRAAWYRSRYVRDDQVVAAKQWPPVAGPDNPLQLLGGIVNTNIIAHAGRLWALVEAGNLPVELDNELETVARTNMGGTLPVGFTAHPHLDPETGELHAVVYSLFWTHIQYLVVGTDGRVRKSVNIQLPGLPMIHDCMFTKHYVILLDLPMVADESIPVSSGALPFRWTPGYGARVGLLPREGTPKQISWHELELCYVFHIMNGFEDDQGRVILDVIRHSSFFDVSSQGEGNSRPPTLVRWTIDPQQTSVQEQCLDDRPQEFPRIDERLTGKPYRYGYTSPLPTVPDIGLTKYDLKTGRSETHLEGRHRTSLEPVFVPRALHAAEDDGWVMAFVYDQEKNSSDVVIIQARDFAAEPVAIIHLPRRVPFGFHGNWVPSSSFR